MPQSATSELYIQIHRAHLCGSHLVAHVQQHAVLSVHAVLRLVKDHGVGCLHGLVIALHAALRWQAMHEDGMLLHVILHELPAYLHAHAFHELEVVQCHKCSSQRTLVDVNDAHTQEVPLQMQASVCLSSSSRAQQTTAPTRSVL